MEYKLLVNFEVSVLDVQSAPAPRSVTNTGDVVMRAIRIEPKAIENDA